MKTKKRSENAPTVNLVGFDPVLFERIRASLGRSPFHFTSTDEPMPVDEIDLFVVAAGHVGSLAHGGVPVVAHGPASMMRGAILAGCTDYLKEPWTPQELELRVNAVLSRQGSRWELPWGEVRLEGSELRTRGGGMALTYHQAVILRALLRQRGQPVPRVALACLLGGGGTGNAASRSIDVHISALRRRVRAAFPEAGRLIVCVRGKGYMIP